MAKKSGPWDTQGLNVAETARFEPETAPFSLGFLETSPMSLSARVLANPEGSARGPRSLC